MIAFSIYGLGLKCGFCVFIFDFDSAFAFDSNY
jgi:hypothetical protein